MVVMTPREKWTDERLDDLNKKVDDGFARVERRIDRLDEDIKELRRDMMAGFLVVVTTIIGSNAFF